MKASGLAACCVTLTMLLGCHKAPAVADKSVEDKPAEEAAEGVALKPDEIKKMG